MCSVYTFYRQQPIYHFLVQKVLQLWTVNATYVPDPKNDSSKLLCLSICPNPTIKQTNEKKTEDGILAYTPVTLSFLSLFLIFNKYKVVQPPLWIQKALSNGIVSCFDSVKIFWQCNALFEVANCCLRGYVTTKEFIKFDVEGIKCVTENFVDKYSHDVVVSHFCRALKLCSKLR